VALEKGTGGPAEIDADLDEVAIEPIQRLFTLERYHLFLIPKTLEGVRGEHPRLYLNRERVVQLRRAIGGTHKSLWEELRALADRAVRRGPPDYRRRDSYSGDEQLWQRGVGNTLPVLAMAHLLSGEEKYLKSAREWALKSCGYETWGLGRIDGMDLAAGHQLLGLALVYDWCHGNLDGEALKTIRETLCRRASAMFEAAATGKIWWRRSYLQNHLWVNACGMAAAGFALFDEEEAGLEWIGLARQKFRRTQAALGPDGASHEGVGYWEYGVEYLLKYMHLSRELLGEDLYDCDWWRNTASYAQYLALPRKAWTRSSCIVDIADCPRAHWYGPDYLLRGLAREYRDGYAQWLAREADGADVCAPGAPWLNLVWFDPDLEAKPPDTRPLLHHFQDMGIVSARSGWSGDESLVVFKCGPFIGHKGVEEFSYDPGGGHVHPDANHFVLFGGGEWLIRDDGYRAKWTGQHNTLLVGGRGQLGEGREWFNGSEPLALKSRPRVVRASSTPALDHIAGDAAAAYPRELGLRRFTRHLLFLKPAVLIVVDDISLERESELELRFHPEEEKDRREGNTFLFPGKAASLRMDVLTPEDLEISAGSVPAESRRGTKDSMFALRLLKRGDRWRNAAALSWGSRDETPAPVALARQENVWTFSAGNQTVTFSWKTGAAEIR